jgi:hypothetical protein
VSTLVMAVMLSPSARAQQERRDAAAGGQSAAHTNETIHGIVAGITAEGEVFFNHQTSTAVKAEGAFLTVVGSPIHSEAAGAERRSATADNERRAGAGGHRHNVYVVWLTPKTKVCQETRETGSTEHAKKECALDELEVGDRVEVQFTREEDSAPHQNVHQSQQMRQKHGRHRTHVGYATAITIMPPREHAQSSSATGARSNEGSK